MTDHQIAPAQLPEAYAQTTERRWREQLDDDDAAHLAATRFVVVSTVSAAGVSVSPRGGEPGACIRVLDATTVLLPDAGGRGHQTIANLTADPRIGLLCMVPGEDRMLRLEGQATVVTGAGIDQWPASVGEVRSVLRMAVRAVRRSGRGPLGRSSLGFVD